MGTRLLDDLVRYARQSGLRVLQGQLLAEQAWLAGLLGRYGPSRLHNGRGGVCNVTLRLGTACGPGQLLGNRWAATVLSCRPGEARSWSA